MELIYLALSVLGVLAILALLGVGEVA